MSRPLRDRGRRRLPVVQRKVLVGVALCVAHRHRPVHKPPSRIVIAPSKDGGQEGAALPTPVDPNGGALYQAVVSGVTMETGSERGKDWQGG